MRFKKLLTCYLALLFALTAYAEEQGLSGSLVFVKQNSKPKYFEDNQQGLCGEIYSALQKQLSSEHINVVIHDNNYPIKRILVMLEKGDAHVFCGAGRNKDREKRYVYSSYPVYEVANVVSAKQSASFELSSIQDIIDQNLVVGALFGTSSAKWLQSHEGVRVNDNFHVLEKALERLANHPNIDLFYYHDLGLNYLTRNLGLPLKVLPAKFRQTPQWLLYSKLTPPKHVEQLDKALERIIKSGELKTIQRKYLVE